MVPPMQMRSASGGSPASTTKGSDEVAATPRSRSARTSPSSVQYPGTRSQALSASGWPPVTWAPGSRRPALAACGFGSDEPESQLRLLWRPLGSHWRGSSSRLDVSVRCRKLRRHQIQHPGRAGEPVEQLSRPVASPPRIHGFDASAEAPGYPARERGGNQEALPRGDRRARNPGNAGARSRARMTSGGLPSPSKPVRRPLWAPPMSGTRSFPESCTTTLPSAGPAGAMRRRSGQTRVRPASGSFDRHGVLGADEQPHNQPELAGSGAGAVLDTAAAVADHRSGAPRRGRQLKAAQTAVRGRRHRTRTQCPRERELNHLRSHPLDPHLHRPARLHGRDRRAHECRQCPRQGCRRLNRHALAIRHRQRYPDPGCGRVPVLRRHHPAQRFHQRTSHPLAPHRPLSPSVFNASRSDRKTIIGTLHPRQAIKMKAICTKT